MRHSIYACIRLLFANFLTLKMLRVIKRYVHVLALISITFFFVADVKCGLCEIDKNNRANATLHIDRVRSRKCSKTEPKQCWTEEIQEHDLY